jgi:uncharacterized membrane protein
VGSVVAVPVVIFAPGYALVAALFPGKEDLDWIERLALSLGLGIAVVPLIGLALNFTSSGITLTSIGIATALFTVGTVAVALSRRLGLPIPSRPSLSLNIRVPTWGDYGLLDKSLILAVASSLLVAAGAFSYVLLAPQPSTPFTEFFILGPGGNATGYPSHLNLSQPGSIVLGMVNRESTSMTYRIRVDLVGVRVGFNTTSGHNETVEVNRTTLYWFNVTLANGQNWIQGYTFRVNQVGLWMVQFSLYKDSVLSNQRLHLYITVS